MIFKATYKDQYIQEGNWPAGTYSFQAKVKGASYSIAVFTDDWEEIDLSWQVEAGEWRDVYNNKIEIDKPFTKFSLIHSEVTGEVLISEPMFEMGTNLSTPSVSPLDQDEVSENISERVTVNFDILDDRIDANVTSIQEVTDDVSGLTTRVETAEAEITVQAGLIDQKAEVTDVTALGARVTTAENTIDAHTGQINSKVSQTDYNTNNTAIDERFSTIEQTATNISLRVEEAKSEAISAASSDATNKVDGLKTDLSGTGIDITAGTLTLFSGAKDGNPGGKVIIAGSNFSVDDNGKIYAKDAEIEGTVNATSGAIGDLSLYSGKLSSYDPSLPLIPLGNHIVLSKDEISIRSLSSGDPQINTEASIKNSLITVKSGPLGGPYNYTEIKPDGIYKNGTKVL